MIDHWRSELHPGQRIDALDTEAVVVALTAVDAYIHYRGWETKFDEWLLVSSKRLAPAYSFVSRWREQLQIGDRVQVGTTISYQNKPKTVWRTGVVAHICSEQHTDATNPQAQAHVNITLEDTGEVQWMDCQDDLLSAPSAHRNGSAELLDLLGQILKQSVRHTREFSEKGLHGERQETETVLTLKYEVCESSSTAASRSVVNHEGCKAFFCLANPEDRHADRNTNQPRSSMKTASSPVLPFVLLTAAAVAAHAAPAQEATSAPHAVVFEPLHKELLDSAYTQGGPISFDFYVLAQSWQPEFCHGKVNQYPGCKEPLPFWRTHFTMHGLWPELAKGPHPGFCGGDPFDAASVEKAIGRDALVEYWPDVKFSESSPQYPDFWKHEWTRHGTCSGMDQVTYFTTGVNFIRNGTATTPDLIQQNVNKTISVDSLRSAFGGNAEAAVLQCMHGDVLSQVFTCWDKDAQNKPTTRRPCPEHVLKEDTCTESTIFIPSFP